MHRWRSGECAGARPRPRDLPPTTAPAPARLEPKRRHGRPSRARSAKHSRCPRAELPARRGLRHGAAQRGKVLAADRLAASQGTGDAIDRFTQNDRLGKDLGGLRGMLARPARKLSTGRRRERGRRLGPREQGREIGKGLDRRRAAAPSQRVGKAQADILANGGNQHCLRALPAAPRRWRQSNLHDG